MENLDELSNASLASHSAKRFAQVKKLSLKQYQSPDGKKLQASAEKSKFRHMDAPDKITPKALPGREMNDAEKAAHEKSKKDAADDLNNRGYGKGRYMADSVEQDEVDQLTEAEAQKLMSNAMDNIPADKRDAARATYKKARSVGQSHAAALNTMFNRHMKNEDVDFICKQIQREHLLETGELLTLNQIKESDSAIDGSSKGPISRASAKHGRIKPMSGTKTIATKIATILAKKV